jgi:hypothetical protein
MHPGGPGADEAAPVRRPARLVPLVLLVALAAVAVAALGPWRASPDAAGVRPPAEDPAPPAEGEPSGAGAAADLGEVVEDLAGFVEEARGLRFREEVEVELLDAPAFRQRLLDDALADLEELDDVAALLRALGLLEGDVDLAEVVPSLLGDSVLGFYDPATDELVVRGGEPTLLVRSTIVHELVHALDDQHFDLDRPELDDADDESAFGFLALVEGNAVRVERAWTAALPDEDRRRLRAEERALLGDLDPDAFPVVLVQLIGLPYVLGPDLVDAILVEGGQPALDAAYADPPTTSAQVLDPARHLAGEGAVPVAAPPAEGEVLDEGPFGAVLLLLTLEPHLGGRPAAEAAAAWAGDRYVMWEEDGRHCVRTSIVATGPGAARRLTDALDRWAEAHGDASVRAGDGQVTFTACG